MASNRNQDNTMMAEVPTSYTDLLIIGAGPAGMMAAAWADQFPMSTRIIDKNGARISKGQADGLQARTLEIFDSFGVVDGVWKKGFHDIEICTWISEACEGIKRTQRVLSQKRGISRFTQTCINQAIIEQTFVDLLGIKDRLRVERNVVTETLLIERKMLERQDTYPVTVKVRHVCDDKVGSFQNMGEHSKPHSEKVLDDPRHNFAAIGRQEAIRAKYILACDGAHSWTRKQLDLPMEGEQTDYIWGVIDIIPLTDFPDIRQACAIHSAKAGSILNVPREEKLNRLYVQLGLEDNIQNRDKITPKTMIKAAQEIMVPYHIDYKYCDWWSLYKIGQRIAPRFSVDDRVFLAGDAVHTHSPKLGQGMNVSMQDTYNLVWKLGSVICGSAKSAILTTYNFERRQVALDLLECDREIAQFYARKSTVRKTIGNASEERDFGKIRERMHEFLAGAGITYRSSVLVASSGDNSMVDSANGHGNAACVIAKVHLATKIRIGARIPSFKIISQAEARPIHLADTLKSDGRWRLLVFAGDIKDPSQFNRVQGLGNSLAGPKSILRRFTPSCRPLDSVIEVLAIHSSPRIDVTIFDFPEIFRPWDDRDGWDYTKIFVDDQAHHEGFANAYDNYGISRQHGCLVICRPDQHVGYIGALEDLGDVEKYFDGILFARN